MNRRDLIKRCAGAVAGMGGVVLGVRAAPVEIARTASVEKLHIFLHAEPNTNFQSTVVKAVMEDARANGPIREIIRKAAQG